MQINKYTIGAIYLIFALIFSIGLVIYEAYINKNWLLLTFIPFVIVLWVLNVEYLAIDKEYHDY